MYYLVGQDLKDCIRIGKERTTNNRQANTKNLNFSKRNDELISIQGVIGEFVFCKLFQIDTAPLADTRCRNRWNDSFDARIANKTIDVKTPFSHDSELWVTISRGDHPPDLYCLMTLERPDALSDDMPFDAETESVEVQFHGFIHRGQLLRGGNIKRRGKQCVYVAQSSMLLPLEELINVESRDLPRLF